MESGEEGDSGNERMRGWDGRRRKMIKWGRVERRCEGRKGLKGDEAKGGDVFEERTKERADGSRNKNVAEKIS